MIRIVLLVWAMIVINGCSNLGYYHQAANGHLQIMWQRQPIAALLTDPTTPQKLRQQLQLAQQARNFATTELLLPDNASYHDYVDLQRPFVVWNVVATPALSLTPVNSCFLIVGCLAYRGYFDKQQAQQYADTLAQQQQLDIAVSGVTAYSTLGWFSDPLLNTLLQRGDMRMVEVMFHELAHQQLYIDNDSTFNESYATAVAHIGMQRWFAAGNSSGSKAAFAAAKLRSKQFTAMLLQTRSRLQNIYKQQLTASEKQQKKQQEFARLQQQYSQLQREWYGYDGYDKWMAQPLNNAHLALIATYHDWVDAFLTLYQRNNNDLQQFYNAVAEIAKLPTTNRTQMMRQLLQLNDEKPQKKPAISG